ncbi:TPR-like protein [Corynespora cassiicola Philippines]|uniref:TPR-like protein n=1 Tax=Corynespora cassiicola Philippines TaxID=1448308 RepID=A0A2T2N1A7_CORCC|nr:TPR-like protein [Corynespora cassiicola Philippines]
MASAMSFGDANAGFQAGVVNGSVSTTHVYSPARPETPPRPSCAIPFRRDPDFVDRRTLLNQIHEKCRAPASRIALVGLGGVGKSQLAIEHCYRTAERWPDTWVFWVHASNAARLEQSYRDIADQVKLAGRKEPQANVFELVRDWLHDEKHGRWLLVLDNADDAAVLSAPSSHDQPQQPQHLSRYLPPSKHGSVLVTSRTRHAASRLVEENDIVSIKAMDEAHALALFEKKLGVQENSGDIAELAAALEYMPLAIVQAAAYILRRAPRCSVPQYLADFRKSDSEKTSLLDYEAGQLRRDEEAKNSIMITWQISFNYIQRARPSAADLLSLMSFFDPQGIPETLVFCRREAGEASQVSHGRRARAVRSLKRIFRRDKSNHIDREQRQESSGADDSNDDRRRLDDDLTMLRDYSFLAVVGDGTTFEMHALVQLAMHKWLQANNQFERWKQQFISNLSAAFPTGHYENWESCRALFPHAKSAAGQKPQEASSLEEWAMLMYRAAWYAEQIGDVANAEALAVQSMKVRKKVLGPDHEDTLWSIAMVADAYSLGGRYKEAEALRMKVMETRKTKLGDDHPDTLTSMANLASTYSNQGRWDKAEKLFVQVVKTRKMKLGDGHPSTLGSMANLASTYMTQGRWDQAEKLEVEVMRTLKDKIGPDHPDTLTVMANLASTYRNQGRWDDAEELEVEAMRTRKDKLGPDHPDTLSSVADLALIYSNQGLWDKAEKLQVEVMKTSKDKLGPDHPSTLASMKNLAFTWKDQGREDEAISLMRECVRLQCLKLGASHPSYISSSKSLAEWEAERVNVT